MRHGLRKSCCILLAVATATAMSLVAVGCTSENDSAEPTTSVERTQGSTAHNAADVTFLTQMIAHHQEAVEMSDLVLAEPAVTSGRGAEVRVIAQQIRDAQDPEVVQMKAWLKAWGAEADSHSSMDGMDGMDMSGESPSESGMNGMMTKDQSKQLSAATGADLDRLYLELMIAHHQGAVAMAQEELDSGENPGALKLAQGVIDTQQAEILQMQALLTAGR